MRALGPRSLASVLKLSLDITYFLAFIPVAVVLGAMVVVSIVHSDDLTVQPPVGLHFQPDAYDLRPNDPGIRRFELTHARATLELEGVPRGPFLAGLAFALLEALFLLAILHQLRAVFRTLVRAEPFDPANAGRVRAVGLAVIVWELLMRAWTFAGWFLFVAGRVSVHGVRLQPMFEPSWLALGAGVALILVAEVLREGARLREEQRLTV